MIGAAAAALLLAACTQGEPAAAPAAPGELMTVPTMDAVPTALLEGTLRHKTESGETCWIVDSGDERYLLVLLEGAEESGEELRTSAESPPFAAGQDVIASGGAWASSEYADRMQECGATGRWLTTAIQPGDGRTVQRVQMTADWPVYETAAALAERADTIVRGVVRSSRTEMIVHEYVEIDDDDPMRNPQAGLSEEEMEEVRNLRDGYVATIHTVEITGVIQGAVKVGATVTIEQMGGVHGQEEHVVPDLEQMSVGQEYLLFTRQVAEGELSLVNLSQTIYTISSTGGLAPLSERPVGFIVDGTLATAEELFGR